MCGGGFVRIEILDAAGYASNSYLLIDDTHKQFAVVDPSVDPSVADSLVAQGYSLQYVLLTHGHFDHILFVDEWRAKGAKVCIHEGDADFLSDPAKSLYLQFFARDTRHAPADIILHEGSRIVLGETEIAVINTPGHTQGSVCYLFENVMISGDTLFNGSIGRTDLPGSSATDMQATIARLSALSVNYTVFPGHGGKTTIEQEKTHGYLHK